MNAILSLKSSSELQAQLVQLLHPIKNLLQIQAFLIRIKRTLLGKLSVCLVILATILRL